MHSHHLRRFDAEVGEGAGHLAAGDGGGGQQESAARGVLLGEDVVAVVEVVELLRELEGVAREMRRLGGGDGLLDHAVRREASSQVSQRLVPSSPLRR